MFLTNFERLAAISNWDEARKKEIFPLCLSGPPKYYYNTHKEALNALAWHELRKRFADHFTSSKLPSSAAIRYRTRQQGKDEPLTHYLYEKKYLADLYDPKLKFGDFLTDAILGMLSHNIYHFAQQTIPTFQQLIEMANTHERAESMVQHRTDARPSNSAPTSPPPVAESVNDITSRLDKLQLLLHTHINSATSSPVAMATPPPPPHARSPSPKYCCNHQKAVNNHHHSCNNDFTPQSSRSGSPACNCPVHPNQYYRTENNLRNRSPSPYHRQSVKFSDQRRSQSHPGSVNRQSRQRFKNENRQQHFSASSGSDRNSYRDNSDRSSYRSTSSGSNSSNQSSRNHYQRNTYQTPYHPSAMFAPPYPYPYYPVIPPFPFNTPNQAGSKN